MAKRKLVDDKDRYVIAAGDAVHLHIMNMQKAMECFAGDIVTESEFKDQFRILCEAVDHLVAMKRESPYTAKREPKADDPQLDLDAGKDK